jgi:hypothetical protein
VLLPHDLVQGARAHPHRERAGARVAFAAFLGGGGEKIWLHVLKPRSRH